MTTTPEQREQFEALQAEAAERLNRNWPEIQDTFRRVSSGELEMVETLTDPERDITRTLFGQLAEQDPALIQALIDWLLGTIADVEDLGCGQNPIPDFIENVLPDIVKEARDAYHRKGLAGVTLIVMSYVFYESFHYPQPETGAYDIAGNSFDKLKWVYRYWFNQLEVAELGSGLEEFFLDQNLSLFADEDKGGVNVARASITCAGDLLAVDVLTPENTPNLFDDIVDFFSDADIVSANLESTVYDGVAPGRHEDTEGQGKPFKMNTSREMFDKFRNDAGINYFATATNHANDFGTEGILATLDVLRDSGAYHSGTAASDEEQDDVVVVVVDGIKIALLSYTFDLNGRALPGGQEYLANEVRFNDVRPAPDYSLVEQQIDLARAKGAGFIIAYCHWGWEFEMYPHENIVEAAHEVVALGVDVIFGNHPHVSQPAQLIDRGAHKQPALVIYAFGDFVSYHPQSRNSKLAYMVKLKIEQSEFPQGEWSAPSWRSLESVPIYLVNEHLSGDSFDCRIVKFDDVLTNPDGYGLTEREKSELPHLKEVVWDRILYPISSSSRSGRIKSSPRSPLDG